MAISGMRGIGMFDPPSSTKAVVLAGPAASDKGAAKAQQKVELQDPYRQFIQDASKLYVDALKHNTTQIAKLIAVCASRGEILLLMSAWGQKRPSPAYRGMSAFGGKADNVRSCSRSEPCSLP